MRRGLCVVVASFAAFLSATPGASAAGWCGSGETAVDRPEVVTGQQVHAVVAVPSDGVDSFAADAGRLADDVASITTWWQAQDPTRVPRFDQALFGGSTCLDISFVRLSGTGASYAASPGIAFRRVASEVALTGLGNLYKKYLVYYAGPSVQADVCGTASGELGSGRAYAVVWLSECTDVPSDTVAAHELLHTFGALPDGAPHACPGDRGHPCDSTADVLYPYASGGPLSALVLDAGRDDYYGHGGSWGDLQDSLWLHRLGADPVALTVSLAGGPGQVRSDVPGVDCAAACTTQWDEDAQVRLTATAGAGDRFVRWAGSCGGASDCVLRLAQASTAVAVFGPLRIAVRISVSGKGRVACTPRCGRTAAAGEPLTLRAVAAGGWRFGGWTGACRGKGVVCRPSTEDALTTRAVFRKRR